MSLPGNLVGHPSPVEHVLDDPDVVDPCRAELHTRVASMNPPPYQGLVDRAPVEPEVHGSGAVPVQELSEDDAVPEPTDTCERRRTNGERGWAGVRRGSARSAVADVVGLPARPSSGLKNCFTPANTMSSCEL